MSTPSPLQPQGAIDGTAPKSKVRITVLTILALHVVFVGGLLMQGCNPKGTPAASTATDGGSNSLSSLPPLNSDTNSGYYSAPPTDAYSTTTTATGTPGGATPSGATGFGAPGTGAGATLPPVPPNTTGAGTGTGAGFHASTPGGAYPGAPLDNSAASSSSLPPATGLPSTSSSGGLTTEHVIKKGDLIRDIAKKYGVTEQAILDANPGVKPRNLKINDKINIPAPTAHAATPASPTTVTSATTGSPDAPLPAAGETYVVKPGDNLTKIAKKFGVTPAQIRAANQLRNDRIVAKQRLKIPARTPARQEPAANSGPAI